MTYPELLVALFAARRFGVVLGLDRVQAKLAALGHPEHRLARVLHVAGTNGKGSTVAFAEALARQAGLRTGAFTSPHLNHFAERFRIDGAPAPESAILAAAERVRDAGGEALTFFEQVTAIGVVLFADAGLDLAILEIGLGGRFDATNAVDGDAAIITGVALDHQAQLGDTLAAIAGEKAGVARAGRPCVIGAAGEPEGRAPLEAAVRARGAAPLLLDDAGIAARVPAGWTLGIPGRHQRANAAAAREGIAALGVALDDGAAARALASARLAGRLERVADDPPTIADGAHNPHAAAAIAAEVATWPAPLACVLGVSAGKDLDGVVGPLARAARWVVATEATSDRAAPAVEVAAAVARQAPDVEVVTVADVDRALAIARGLGAAQVLVAGSLFLVADARRILAGAGSDPLDLSDPLR